MFRRRLDPSASGNHTCKWFGRATPIVGQKLFEEVYVKVTQGNLGVRYIDGMHPLPFGLMRPFRIAAGTH